jgi:hypothetical protein
MAALALSQRDEARTMVNYLARQIELRDNPEADDAPVTPPTETSNEAS